MLVLIGLGGPGADVLAAIWLAMGVLALFLIPRDVRVRVAKRFGLGIRPRLGEPGLPASSKTRAFISALVLLLALLIFLSRLIR